MPDHMSEFSQREQSAETEEMFAARVLERTGVALSDIAPGNKDELLSAHIFCQRGNTYVVAVGQPTRVDADGTEFWEDPSCFRKITT